jgi:hypothetical protein
MAGDHPAEGIGNWQLVKEGKENKKGAYAFLNSIL